MPLCKVVYPPSNSHRPCPVWCWENLEDECSLEIGDSLMVNYILYCKYIYIHYCSTESNRQISHQMHEIQIKARKLPQWPPYQKRWAHTLPLRASHLSTAAGRMHLHRLPDQCHTVQCHTVPMGDLSASASADSVWKNSARVQRGSWPTNPAIQQGQQEGCTRRKFSSPNPMTKGKMLGNV